MAFDNWRASHVAGSVLVSRLSPEVERKLVIAVAFIPIFIGVFIELRDQWRVARETPDQLREGSPVGNAIAWVLAVPLALLLLYVVYRMIAGIT